MSDLKVRFAPSPTGFLHIGGARTALFSWLYAKAQKGKFVLRIEDTDMVRSEKRFEEEILDSMAWLGMDWDELHRQSERFDIYKDYANKLVDQGLAYRDGTAVLLKIPNKNLKIYDLIRGEIDMDTSLIKDQVLLKSDGSPAYSFACVVDDALMGITCVIRGEDHIPNTPKQMMIYEALGFKIPKYAHLPLIMGEDGTRLSKRTGAVAVSEYRTAGFLPQAMMNYLLLLGWAPGQNQEIIAIKSAIQKFSIKKVNKSAAIFSLDKLRWVNKQYIKNSHQNDLFIALKPLLVKQGIDTELFGEDKLKALILLYKSRMDTLEEFIERTRYAFTDQIDLDKELLNQIGQSERDFMLLLSKALSDLDTFLAANIEAVFQDTLTQTQCKPGELIKPLRIALTGMTIGPGLFEIMEFLGQVKVCQRLKI